MTRKSYFPFACPVLDWGGGLRVKARTEGQTLMRFQIKRGLRSRRKKNIGTEGKNQSAGGLEYGPTTPEDRLEDRGTKGPSQVSGKVYTRGRRPNEVREDKDRMNS